MHDRKPIDKAADRAQSIPVITLQLLRGPRAYHIHWTYHCATQANELLRIAEEALREYAAATAPRRP